ncbi:MAG: hypothetical protein QNJ47_27200 [Nostocaceae cyanobacterium]|nr:hypothetical protein [Nostocaceae cyanobacterium]
MRVWLACFFVLFALAQFFDWVQQLSLPLPIYILAGAFLAVASNYEKLFGSYIGDNIGVNMEASTEEVQLDSLSEPTEAIPLSGSNLGKQMQASETQS